MLNLTGYKVIRISIGKFDGIHTTVVTFEVLIEEVIGISKPTLEELVPTETTGRELTLEQVVKCVDHFLNL